MVTPFGTDVESRMLDDTLVLPCLVIHHPGLSVSVVSPSFSYLMTMVSLPGPSSISCSMMWFISPLTSAVQNCETHYNDIHSIVMSC